MENEKLLEKDVFNFNDGPNTTFPVNKGEIVYSHESYAKDLYALYSNFTPISPKVFETYKGSIVEETEKEILVEIGAKDVVRVIKENREVPYFQGKAEGDSVKLMIVNIVSDPYQIIGSVARLYEVEAKKEIEALDKDTPVKVKVNNLVGAGFECSILMEDCEVDAFMPNILSGVNKLTEQAMNDLLGTEIEVMIDSFSKEKDTYIVSRRAYLQSLIPQAVKELNEELRENPNKVFKGEVTGSKVFGVFVEFNGCLTSMIHKTNMHPDYQDDLDKIEPGTPIEFYIKEVVNKKRNLKIIATQILEETLWDTIRVGQRLEGIVKSNRTFGALVSLDKETQGLIYVDLLEKHERSYEPGDLVDVEVLKIDRLDRKIYLDIVS